MGLSTRAFSQPLTHLSSVCEEQPAAMRCRQAASQLDMVPVVPPLPIPPDPTAPPAPEVGPLGTFPPHAMTKIEIHEASPTKQKEKFIGPV
jgi:hypothetical protein